MSLSFLNCFTEQTIAQDTDGSQELWKSRWILGKNLNLWSDGKTDRVVIMKIIYDLSAFAYYLFFNLAHILEKLQKGPR